MQYNFNIGGVYSLRNTGFPAMLKSNKQMHWDSVTHLISGHKFSRVTKGLIHERMAVRSCLVCQWWQGTRSLGDKSDQLNVISNVVES